MAIGQMASDTGSHGRPITLRHDARHRRMLIGKPIRRMHRIVDLRLSVAFGAARNLLQNAVIRFAWIRNAGTIRTESPFRALLRIGQAGQQKHYCENCPLHPAPMSAAAASLRHRTARRIFAASPVTADNRTGRSIAVDCCVGRRAGGCCWIGSPNPRNRRCFRPGHFAPRHRSEPDGV
jgi:hypothetical protein